MNHHDLLWRIGGYEPERGSAVAGHRGYVMMTDMTVDYSKLLLSYSISSGALGIPGLLRYILCNSISIAHHNHTNNNPIFQLIQVLPT